jgi:hypothetical protein
LPKLSIRLPQDVAQFVEAYWLRHELAHSDEVFVEALRLLHGRVLEQAYPDEPVEPSPLALFPGKPSHSEPSASGVKRANLFVVDPHYSPPLVIADIQRTIGTHH